MPEQVATMTAARAIIKTNGVPIGYVKNLRITESKQRGTVMGLGEVTKKERPLLSITCTWNCDFYLIDLSVTGIPGLDNREVQSVQQYKDTQTLLNIPVDFVVYKKDVLTVSNNVVTATKNKVLCTIKDVYLDNTNWDFQENAISSLSQSGEYTTPVILAV
jgi:sporulation protein YlmC with PRC-barrel domain